MVLFDKGVVDVSYVKNSLNLILVNCVVSEKQCLNINFIIQEMYYRLHKYKTAIEKNKAILKFQPTNCRAFVCLGRIHFEKEDYAAAATSFEAALKIEPQNPEARCFVEAIKYRTGETSLETALVIFQGMVDDLKARPLHPLANLFCVDILISQNQVKMAKLYFERYLSFKVHASHIATLLAAKIAIADGKISEAIKSYEAVRLRGGEFCVGLGALGEYAYSTVKDYAGTIMVLSKILEFKKNAEDHYRRACAFFAVWNVHKALEDCVAAVAMDPDFISPFELLTRIYFDAANFNSALESIVEVCKEAHEFSSWHLIHAAILIALNQNAQAEPIIKALRNLSVLARNAMFAEFEELIPMQTLEGLAQSKPHYGCMMKVINQIKAAV